MVVGKAWATGNRETRATAHRAVRRIGREMGKVLMRVRMTPPAKAPTISRRPTPGAVRTTTKGRMDNNRTDNGRTPDVPTDGAQMPVRATMAARPDRVRHRRAHAGSAGKDRSRRSRE